MQNEQPCIAVNDLQLLTDDGTVWSNISFSLDPGHPALLTGLTPVARTILLRMIAGLSAFHTGSISLWNKPITMIDRHWLSAHVRFITSRDQPGFSFSVQEFISKGCEFGLRPFRTPGKEEHATAETLMKALDMVHLARRDCSQLGKSDLLRALVAQAIMCQPALLLIDDPIDDISESVREPLLRYLTRQAAAGRTIVMTSHKADQAFITPDFQLIQLDDTVEMDIRGTTKHKADGGFIF